MAARRRGRTRTVYRAAKRGYSRRKGLISGQMANVAWGAGAGMAAPYIPRIVGKWTLPLVFGAAGYLLKKPALLAIAGYEIGRGFSLGGAIGSGAGFTGQS